MVGFYDSAPLDSISLRQQGTDVIPSTTGQVLGAAFGEGLAENLTPRLFRANERFAAETGVIGVTDLGMPVYGEPEPLLQPDEANAQYGIKGALSFSAPVAQSVAKDLYDHKKAQLEREDTIARREGGLLQGGAARFSASLAAGFLDPLNIAAGFIPVVGEAREAALLARAAGAVGRAGVRAGLGAAQGALGMAALQPLEFGLSRQEQEDYTMATALRSIALGGVLGGGLHAGIGAIVDRAARPLANPLAERIEAVGPEARETLMQGALAQTIEGRPVNVAPAFDALEAARAPVQVEARTPEVVAGEPSKPPGTVRFYHGGVLAEDARWSRWLTEDRAYAEGYVAKHAGGNAVLQYVDIPEAELQRRGIAKQFDDTGTDQRAPYVHFDAPEQIASQLRPLNERASATEAAFGEAPGTFRTTVEKNGERTVIEGPVDALRPGKAVAAEQTRQGEQSRLRMIVNETDLPLEPGDTRQVFLGWQTPEGKDVAAAYVKFRDGGRTAFVESVSSVGGAGLQRGGYTLISGQPGVLGPRSIREMARQIFQEFPEVETISGLRISGARAEPEALAVTRGQVMGRDIAEAARESVEPDATVTQQAAEVQARAPNLAERGDPEIVEAQRQIDEITKQIDPNDPTVAAALKEASDIAERSEQDARAYEAAANCIAERGL